MIKLVYAIERRADVPLADFYDYWLRSHGPRVKGHAEAIKARRYVQSHTVDTPANQAMRESRGMLAPLPGITEVWWDCLADFQAALAEPAGQAAMADLAEDEAKFIDTAKSQIFLTREKHIFDFTGAARLGPEVAKVTYLLSRRDGMSVEACHATWLADHGPLVASFARASRMARYVQSHAIAPGINAAIGTSRGLAPPLDGITEVWIKPGDDPSPDPETARRAGPVLIEDERRFVEMGRSRCFITGEHEIFDYRPSE